MTARGEHRAKREAFEFFGGRACVITGNKLGTSWHHLDERRQNWTAPNIVPIEQGLNQAIETIRRDPDRSSGAVLDPEAIRVRSAELFDIAEFRYSYGAARLGAFLALRRKEYASSLRLAVGALISLRSAPDLRFFADTLRRSIRPLLAKAESAKRIDPLTRALVASELAGWLREFGHCQRGLEVHSSPAARAGHSLWQRDPFHASRAAHCRASTQLRLDPRSVGRRLLEAEDLAYDADFAFGKSNVLLSRVDLALQLNQLDVANECVTAAIEFCGGVHPLMYTAVHHSLEKISWWSAAELLGLKAEVERRIGYPKTSREFAARAFKIYQQARIRPRHGCIPHAVRSLVASMPDEIRITERTSLELRPCEDLVIEIVNMLANDRD